jgi:hypothetical protein
MNDGGHFCKITKTIMAGSESASTKMIMGRWTRNGMQRG